VRPPPLTAGALIGNAAAELHKGMKCEAPTQGEHLA